MLASIAGLSATAGVHAQTIPTSIATNGTATQAGRAPVSRVGSDYQNGGIFVIDSVTDRIATGYEPIGVPVGSFRLFPSVSTGGFYDTNIYALQRNAIGDGGVRITPQVNLVSTWARHSLTLQTSGTASRYLDRTIENSESAQASLRGLLDIDPATRLVSTISFARRIQQRGTEDETVPTVGPPIAYGDLSIALNGQRQFGDLVVTLDATASRARYEDTSINGVRFSLVENNSRTFVGDGRVQFTVGPGIAVFVSGTYTRQLYADSVRFPDRDSSGYSALGGVAFGLTPLLSGRVGLGYLRQGFASSLYADVSGLDYTFNLDWSPTPLFDLHANVGRSFQRAALLGSAGLRLDTAAVTANYELLRNLIVSDIASYTVNDYSGLDRRERRVENTLNARYLANRNLSLVVSGTVSRQRAVGGTVFGRDYDRAIVTLGARVQI